MYILIGEIKGHGEFIIEDDPRLTMAQIISGVADFQYENLNQIIHVDVENGTSEDVTRRVMHTAFLMINPWDMCEEDLEGLHKVGGFLGDLIGDFICENTIRRNLFEQIYFPEFHEATAA